MRVMKRLAQSEAPDCNRRGLYSKVGVATVWVDTLSGSGSRRWRPLAHSWIGGDVVQSGNWLLVFNCTNIGLANSLKLLVPGLEVESIDFGRFKKDFASYAPRLDTFDLILTAPDFVNNQCVDFANVAPVQTVPIPYFDAYHPDLCYLTGTKGILKGPMGDYHSKIITAAYKKRVPKASVRALFTSSRYFEFGYLDRWEPAKAALIDGFANVGLNIDGYFRTWSVRRQFMHSVNHPAIEVVYDMARRILTREEIEYVDTRILPHDNLMNGPIYPVFDEIAERLSIQGSYLFKLPAQYRCITLDQFINASYDFLGQFDPAIINAYSTQHQSFQHVLATL